MNDSDFSDQPPTPSIDSMSTLKVPVVTLHNQHRTPKKSSFMPSKPSQYASPENEVPLAKRTSSPQVVEAQEKMRKLVCANQRTEEEASLLYDKIQHFPFFETFNDRNSNSFFGDDAFIRLCQTARYEKHPAKKVIFKEGDPTNGKLYIIYSGEVSVVKQSSDAFATPNTAEIPDDLTDANSSFFTTAGKEDLRLSRISMEKGSTGSFLISGRESRRIFMDSEAELSAAPVKTSRRHTRITLDMNQNGKQRSDPFTEDGDESAKLERRSIKPELRHTYSGNVSRDSMRWNPNSARDPRPSKSIFDPNEGSRRGSWKVLQHMIPNLAKFKTAVNKKQEAKPLKDVIREYGAVSNKLGVGEFFGERAVFEQSTRPSTIVTNTECEFLVIYKRDFYFVSRNYDRKRTKLLDFIFNFTPDIENIHTFQVAEELLCILKEKTFEKGSLIIEEGKPGNNLVMLFDGCCELVKTLKVDERPSQKGSTPIEQLVRVRPVYSEELLVCNVDRGAVLGEEVIFTEQNMYSFSVRVTSAFATVFMVGKDAFHARFTKLTQNHIRNMFFAKRKKHCNLMRYLIQTKYPALEACPPGETSPDSSSPDTEFRIVSHPVHLRAKERTDAKRKGRVGLFNALVQKGDDNKMINKYFTTSPGELESSYHPAKSARSILENQKIKKVSQPIITEENCSGSELQPNMVPKTLLSPAHKSLNRNTNNPSPSYPAKTRVVSPRGIGIMAPATTRTKLQIKAQEKNLQVETSIDQQDHLIDYIKSSKAIHLHSAANSDALPAPKINLETVRSADPAREGSSTTTERLGLKSATATRFERRIMSELDRGEAGPMDLLSELFESNKKAKKILDIQRSRISPKFRQSTGSSMLDTRISPQLKTEHLIESIKDKLQPKAKASARGMSARANTGPFLLINTSTIETAQSHRNIPKRPGTTTSPLTRKNSSKIGHYTTVTAGTHEMITDDNEDINDKDFGRPLRETFGSLPRADRPFTAKTSGVKSLKALCSSTEDILSKARNDPSTRILRMKHKRNMKLKFKRQSEKMEVGPNKESFVIDYQVNGNLHTYSGQKVMAKSKKVRPLSGINFTKALG